MTHPEKIGRYQIESLLGEGAMGSVFKAFDPIIKRTVAIKTIKMQHFELDSEREQFLKRFNNEAQVCGKLHHPNIVILYDLGQEADGPFIAMEYLEGQTLDKKIKKRQLTDYREIQDVLNQIAEALDYAHEHGIVHRDIKPHNILITNTGMAKMMDFGIAKGGDAKMTKTGFFVGTPSYSSPEQISGEQVDHRSDLFSFGVLAHEFITGHIPFSGHNISSILYQVVNGQPKFEHIPRDLDSLSLEFKQIFTKMLHKNAAERYDSAKAFMQDLNPILGEGIRVTGQQQVLKPTTPYDARTVQATQPQAKTVPQPPPVNTSANTNPMPGWDTPTRQITKPGLTVGKTTGPTALHVQAPTAQTEIQTPSGSKKLGLWLGLASFACVIVLAVAFWPGKPKPNGPIPDPKEVPVVKDPVLPKTKSLFFGSTPQGAVVWVDGREIGATPMTHYFTVDPAKSYSVKIVKEGFEPVERTLDSAKGWDPEMHLTLVELPKEDLPDLTPEQQEDPAALARAREKKAWETIQNSHQINDFDNFLKNYPDSPNRTLAQLRISALKQESDLNAALTSNEPGPARDFLAKYPGSVDADRIRDRLKRFEVIEAYDQAIRANNAGALNALLGEYGSVLTDIQKQTIQSKLKTLNAEKEEVTAYQSVENTNDIFAINAYLSQYGGVNTDHTESVLTRKKALQKDQFQALNQQILHKPDKKYKISDKNDGLIVEMKFKKAPPIEITSAELVWQLNELQPQIVPMQGSGTQFKATVINNFLDNGTLKYHFAVRDKSGERYELEDKSYETEIIKLDAKDKVVITY